MPPIVRSKFRGVALLEVTTMFTFKFARKVMPALLIATGTLGALAIPQVSTASTGVYVQFAPLAPRFERHPEPRHGYNWVPGYWDWRGHRQVWIAGAWVQAHHGYHYQPHRYVSHNNRWQHERNRWDRDGDGVPNRYDRQPDNPYRR